MDKSSARTPSSDVFTAATAPPSPSSSSSSDFEFIVSVSPTSGKHCPADELFYKGQLLPLHFSPRIHLLKTLLAPSTSSSSSDTTVSPRDSNGSSNDSSTFSGDLHLLNDQASSHPSTFAPSDPSKNPTNPRRKSKYFSFSFFSSVFPPITHKRISSSATEAVRKYFSKVKPLLHRLSSKTETAVPCPFPLPAEWSTEPPPPPPPPPSGIDDRRLCRARSSFSGNLSYRRRVKHPLIAASCPSSMRSSPCRSGLLRRPVLDHPSSMEDLQNAIQGAIAHCKNSLSRHEVNKDVIPCS